MMDLLSKVRPPSVDLSSVSGNLPAVSLPGVNLPGVNFLSSGNAPELPVTDYVAQILLKTDPSDLPPSNPEKPELDRPQFTILHGPAQPLQKIPPQFIISEKPLPINQGLLRVQNYNVGNRYCRSNVVCADGIIPLPNILVRTLFLPDAECVVRKGTDYTVTLETATVIDMATVLFILCLRKRPLVTKTSEGEIIEGIQKIMQILRPASAEFIQQEENPPDEAEGDPDYFAARCIRFIIKLEEKEYKVFVNTTLQCRLLEDPETEFTSWKALKERLLKPPPAPEPESKPEPSKAAARAAINKIKKAVKVIRVIKKVPGGEDTSEQKEVSTIVDADVISLEGNTPENMTAGKRRVRRVKRTVPNIAGDPNLGANSSTAPGARGRPRRRGQKKQIPGGLAHSEESWAGPKREGQPPYGQ